MQIDSETLLSDTISNRPEVAPPGSVVIEEMMIGIVFAKPHRKTPVTHCSPPSVDDYRRGPPELPEEFGGWGSR